MTNVFFSRPQNITYNRPTQNLNKCTLKLWSLFEAFFRLAARKYDKKAK